MMYLEYNWTACCIGDKTVATKLLKEEYKTYDGAHKRARFENGVAPSEYKHGIKARLYHYTVIPQENGTWRVQRSAVKSFDYNPQQD